MPSRAPGVYGLCPIQLIRDRCLVGSGGDEAILLDPRQILYLRFPLARGTTGMPGFEIYDPPRFATTKVLGAALIGVLPQAHLDIVGDTRIQRVIRTQYYVDAPTHRFIHIHPPE